MLDHFFQKKLLPICIYIYISEDIQPRPVECALILMVASTVKCLHTSWNCANQSQVSHHGNVSDKPPDSSWSYRTTDTAFMADGLSVWLARRSAIHSGQLAESSYWQEQFQTISEDISVCNVLMHSAH